MKPSANVLLLFLILPAHVLSTESKHQQQTIVDEEEDDDDWDEDDEDDDSDLRPEVDDDGRIYKNPRNSPSAMCPRDEQKAELLRQKCLRKCSTDEDCKSKRKKCRCDGACGMSCIKPDRECPELTDVDHAVMSVTGRLFGDVAHYTCDSDHFLVGLSERRCRADGNWTGSTPSCKKGRTSFCSEPQKMKNARHNALVEQTTFDLDSTVQYFCDYGYVNFPAGFPKAKCLIMNGVASWFGPDMSCEPRNCSDPTDIPNGWHAGECYTYDCRISYHCRDGYELIGRTEKICLGDGTWSPKELPQCVQVTTVQCPPPENPSNGKAVYTSYAYNSIVSYECNYGYTIVGVATRRCGADRKWSGQTPVCKEINCGSPGILYNGWIENMQSGTGLGTSLIFRCNNHMKLEGNASSVCQVDGKWRYPLPQCLAPCVVPQIEYGHVKIASHERDHINNVTVVEHGERLVVECVKNYEFHSNSTPVVCNNGTWSIIPACSPARCKQMPKAPKNGIVIAPKTDHGMRAIFKCKDGFVLEGASVNSSKYVECRYGNWIGEIPHCAEVYCPFPGYIDNGKVQLVGNMGVYDYRHYVRKVVNNKQITYECNRGYVLSEGPPGATCVGGSWSPKELPKCVPGQHPRLRWNRRRRSVETEASKRKTIGAAGYRKFIDFFKKVGKKVSHMEAVRTRDHRAKHDGRVVMSVSNGTIGDSWRRNQELKNRSRALNQETIDFLRVVYRKLERIDARRANRTKWSMHELLNAMSRNFYHVDLTKGAANFSGSNDTGVHGHFKVRNLKDSARLRKDFERILKFYGRSLQWSEKQSRKEARKRAHLAKVRDESERGSKPKKHRGPSGHYRGFYEFMNNYMDEKLSYLDARNVTEELAKWTNVDKFAVRNGTTFTVGEMYALFKHIIENKLNTTDKPDEEATAVAASEPPRANDNQTTPIASKDPTLDNEIPSLQGKDSVPKHRSKRIRKTSEVPGPLLHRRKLLSLNSPLGDARSRSGLVRGGYRPSRGNSKSKEFTLNELEAQQQSHAKRFLAPSELENQIFLKNLYLRAYEDEYRANVKRSILGSNRTSLTALRRRKGSLEEV